MRVFAVLASLVVLAPAPASADTVHEALEAYALYQQDVSILLDLEVDSARDVNGALARLSRHDPERVGRGYIAYGALTAAQSPAFAEGVMRRIARDGRDAVERQVRADFTYVRRQSPGSPQAIRLILNVAGSDGARAAEAGGRFEHIARSSNAAWIASTDRRGGFTRASASLTPEARARLYVGALTTSPMRNAEEFGGRGFWDALAQRQARAQAGGRREQGSYAPVTDRMLSVGALIVASGEEEPARVSPMLDEQLSQQCLMMQRLQLRQCLSVSVDASERTYCLGRHGLIGPGGCFSAISR